MKIILVGVPCVGKSTVGRLLAQRVGYKFFDFDLEVEAYFNSHITFLKQRWWSEHTIGATLGGFGEDPQGERG